MKESIRLHDDLDPWKCDWCWFGRLTLIQSMKRSVLTMWRYGCPDQDKSSTWLNHDIMTVACFVSNLSTGRLRGCTGSTAKQTPPSYGRSSGLHLANGNSTGTACNWRERRGILWCNRSGCTGHIWCNPEIYLLSVWENHSSHRSAWTRLRSANSCSSTKACSTLMLKSSLVERKGR